VASNHGERLVISEGSDRLPRRDDERSAEQVRAADTTRHDTTRHDTTRHDTTRHDTTRHDTTRQSTTSHRDARSLPWCSTSACVPSNDEAADLDSARIDTFLQVQRRHGHEALLQQLARVTRLNVLSHEDEQSVSRGFNEPLVAVQRLASHLNTQQPAEPPTWATTPTRRVRRDGFAPCEAA
jgi:hypothetical protein